MDDAGAKRLVDFAAGLAFALRGSIEKVTNRVFLLSPPNVEVSAAERRKLAEKGFGTSSGDPGHRPGAPGRGLRARRPGDAPPGAPDGCSGAPSDPYTPVRGVGVPTTVLSPHVERHGPSQPDRRIAFAAPGR
jgi:hypothetical protein